MAERVEIRGGELDGSVLENAATEATLLRLVDAFEKKSGPGGGNRLQDLYNKSLKTTIKSTDALAESFEKTRSAVDSMGSALFSLVTKPLTAVVSGATFAVQSITDLLTSSFKNYQGIANVGATFGNNMIEVSRTALNAGMGLGDFTEMIKENNIVLTALGGTASQGAKRLADLRDGIINSDIGSRFYGLGLTTKDVEEYMGSYLDQQQRLGTLQRRDNMTLTKGVAAYVEELDKVTKLTGIERKRLDEQARKIAIDPVFNAIRRGLNPEQLAKSSANLATAAEVGGQEFQDAIKEIATGVIQSPLARQLAASGALTQETAQAIAKGTIDIVPVMQRALGLIDGMAVYSDQALIAANEDIRAVAQFRDRAAMIRDADYQQSIKDQEQRNKLTEAFGKIPAVFDNIKNKIIGSLLSSEIFDKLFNALENISEKLLKYVDPLISYFKNFLQDMSIVVKDQGLLKAFTTGINTLMTDFRKYVVPVFSQSIKEIFGTDDIGKSIKTFLIDGFKSLITGIIGYDQNTDIGEVMKTLLFDGFKSLFTGIFNILKNNWDTIAAGLVGIVAASFLGIVSLPFVAIGAALLAIFGYQEIKRLVGDGIDAIANIGTSIVDFFSWNSMKGYFSSAWNTITGVPSKIMEYFSLESISETFSGAWNTIIGVPSKILEYFNVELVGQIFGNAWYVVTEIPNKILEYFNVELVGEYFSNAWNAITGIPSKIMEYFSLESVQQNFSNAWNAITGVPSKILEYFNLDDLQLPSITEMFNGLVDKIKNFFSIDIDFGGFSDYLPTWLGGEDKPAIASGMQTSRLTSTSNTSLSQDLQSNTGSSAIPSAVANATGLPDITVTLDNLQTSLSTAVGAIANASREQSRQLNTLLEQSIALNTQQLEATQDLLRAIKGSYSPV